MRLNEESIKSYCNNNGLSLKSLLVKAKVSKTAYYSLTRKNNILPKSLINIATTLGIKPSSLLEEESREERKIKRVIADAAAILESNPGLSRDNVIHTLLLLSEKPMERLRRGLLRAKKFDFHR